MTEYKCQHCQEFFEKYSCAMEMIGECDCPKCQGYCNCKDQEDDRLQIQDEAV